MATKSFILIEAEVGKARNVTTAIQKVSGVLSVDQVTGPYDIIVVLEGQDLNAVGDLLHNKIHPIPGIIRTVTCLAISVS